MDPSPITPENPPVPPDQPRNPPQMPKNSLTLRQFVILSLFALFFIVAISLFSSYQPVRQPTPTVPAPVTTGQPGSVFCGGFAGVSCPPGYTCRLDGDYPDAGGTCQAVSAPIPTLSGPAPADTSCKTGGCSGELCLDADAPDQASICVYKDEYACLKYASCEKNGAGLCTWKYTDQYYACAGYE